MKEDFALNQAIFDATQEAIIASDAHGVVQAFNRAAERMLGYAASEVIGRVRAETFHDPEELARDAAALADEFRSASGHNRSEKIAVLPGNEVAILRASSGRLPERRVWTWVRKDGTCFPVRLSLSALIDEDGTVGGFVGIAEDITEQRHREEALRISEERFRLAAEAVNAILYDWNPATGHVERTQGLTAILGVPVGADEPTEHWWTERIHPEDRDRCRETGRLAVENEASQIDLEYRVRHEDGGWRCVRDRARIVRDGESGRVVRVVGSTEDVTQERQAQEELRAMSENLRLSEARFRAAQETSPDGFMLLDSVRDAAAGSITDFRWTYVNEAASRIIGRPREAFLGCLLLEEMPGNKEAGLFDAYVRVVECGEPWQSEFTYALDGVDVYLRTTAAKVGDGFAVSFTDLSDRHKAEIELKASEELVRSIAENSTQGMAMMDENGYCTYANRAWLKMTGFTVEEIGAIPLHYLVHHQHPDGRSYSREECPIERALPENSEVRAHEGLLFRKDGSTFPVLCAASPIFKNGRPTSTVIEIRDMTDTKRIEAQLKAAAAKNERIAETLQHSLMLAPEPDAYPGVTVEAFYQSAWDDAKIGGDFFDVFAVDETHVALVVGDATGKGVEAATYTAEMKFALRAFLRTEGGRPGLALSRLNEFVITNVRMDRRRSESGSYVALVMVVIDTLTGEAACACAGAEPPLVFRGSGGAEGDKGEGGMEEVDVRGLLLGVMDDPNYEECLVTLNEGDTIALTSDGITESRSAGKDRLFFGLSGLARVGSKALANPAPALAQVGKSVVDEALAWAGGFQHDDICLLMARRKEIPAPSRQSGSPPLC